MTSRYRVLRGAVKLHVLLTSMGLFFLLLCIYCNRCQAVGAGKMEIRLDEITPSGLSYTIESDTVRTHVMLCMALYDKNGKLTDSRFEVRDIQRGVESASHFFTGMKVESAKLFLLDADTWQPLAPAAVLVHRVIFQDYNGTTLSEQTVAHRQAAVDPTPSPRSGYVFTGWDRNCTDIQEDTVFRACYAPDTVENIFSVSSASGNPGENVTVLLQLSGNVLLSGFDIQLLYDRDAIELVSIDSELSLDVLNQPLEEDGVILLNYLTARGDRTTGGSIAEVVFKIKADMKGSIPLCLSANAVVYSSSEYGNVPVPAAFSLVDGEILVP